MSVPYNVQTYCYYFARGDHRAIPANADIYVRRASPPLDVIYHVHIDQRGHSRLVGQIWPSGAWQPVHGTLQVQSGSTYASFWVSSTRPVALTAEQIRAALFNASARYSHSVTVDDERARRLFAARFEVPTVPGQNTIVNIDWNLIRRLEGFHPEGEVPGAGSGVTISVGFDLHEKTASDLALHGVPNAVIDQLRPFLAQGGNRAGPVGEIARAALAHWRSAHPGLRELVPHNVCEQIFERTRNIRAQIIASRYNSVSDVPFTAIPTAAQTVIVSVLYQYGNHAEVLWMWQPAIRQDWAGLVQALRRQAEHHFTGRRRQEADYLESALR